MMVLLFLICLLNYMTSNSFIFFISTHAFLIVYKFSVNIFIIDFIIKIQMVSTKVYYSLNLNHNMYNLSTNS